MRNKFITYNPNTQHEGIMIKQSGTRLIWGVCAVDSWDKVAVECITEDGTNTLYLNQDELKQFITFLQKQVK
jgi:Holliday junction resolvase